MSLKTFYVEYEIPPLRAIYHRYFESGSSIIEREVNQYAKKQNPPWHIRKIEACCGACQCRVDPETKTCGCNHPDS